MEDPELLLDHLLAWAASDERVSAVVLTGSRGRGDRVDALSDLDVEIISPHWRELHADDRWRRALGAVLLDVCFDGPDETQLDRTWPAPRLVVLDGGRKLDLTIAGEERLLSQRGTDASALDPLYRRGFRVLFDRVGLAVGVPAGDGRAPLAAPSEAEFRAAVEEFWFEATQVAVHLARRELWDVQHRSHTMQTRLLEALEWHAGVHPRAAVGTGDPDAPGSPDVWHLGHRIEEWLDPALLARVPATFAGYDAVDGARALEHRTGLYAEVTAELATRCGLASPHPLAEGARSIVRATLA